MKEQELIHDEKAENYVIGSLVIDSSAYNKVLSYLDEDCFYDWRAKDCWLAITSMVNENIPVDLVSLSSELGKRKSEVSIEALLKIVENVASSAHVEYHAIRLRNLAIRRKMCKIGVELSLAGQSEVTPIEDIYRNAFEAMQGVFKDTDGISTLSDALASLCEIIKQNLSNGAGITGTPTGFSMFDSKGGLQKSDLIIVAGETSQGKTSLALTMTRNALMNDAKVAFYSMEMTKEQLAARMVSSMTKIPANTILYGNTLDRQELSMIDDARGKLKDKNLYFDDRSTSSLDSILMSIRTMKMQSDIDGAVVDYLQILSVNTKGNSREQVMGEASRRLKNIAKELNIWVIALSQLSRDSNNPEPTLNRLRDSGQIAEAADVVMLVYRPEYYNRSYPSPYENMDEYPTNGTAMIDVAKGRNIGNFKFFLGFDKNTASFYKTDAIEDIPDVPFNIPIEDDAPF